MLGYYFIIRALVRIFSRAYSAAGLGVFSEHRNRTKFGLVRSWSNIDGGISRLDTSVA